MEIIHGNIKCFLRNFNMQCTLSFNQRVNLILHFQKIHPLRLQVLLIRSIKILECNTIA